MSLCHLCAGVLTPPSWDDSDSDYDITEWVNYNEAAWYKIGQCEVFDRGYDDWFPDPRWRKCELLAWRYEGNLSLEYEPGLHICIKFGEEEYEGLPPEMYTLDVRNNTLNNAFDNNFKCRNLEIQ